MATSVGSIFASEIHALQKPEVRCFGRKYFLPLTTPPLKQSGQNISVELPEISMRKPILEFGKLMIVKTFSICIAILNLWDLGTLGVLDF